MKLIERTGKKFGSLLVLNREPNDKTATNNYTMWRVRCDCGRESVIRGTNPRLIRPQECTCITEHGLSGTPEWCTWIAINKRCDPRFKHWKLHKHYSGRGIKVCERWKVFENFLEDMGSRPSDEHSIDRIDNDGDYSPGNCRWATKKEQANNTRRTKFVVVGEKKMTFREACEANGLPYNRAYYRVTKGWSHQDAATKPLALNEFGKQDLCSTRLSCSSRSTPTSC